MVDITYIDHVEQGLGRLPSQWDDSPNLRGLLQSFLEPLNDTESSIIGVRDGFNVNTAVGEQLNIIGNYFGQERQGRTDTEYRAALLSIISTSNGSGTPDQLLDLFGSIAQTGDVKLWEHYPYGISMLATGGLDVEPSTAFYMEDSKAAEMEFAGLLYDTYGYAWIPYDSQRTQYNLVTNLGENIITDTLDQIVVYSNAEEVADGLERSSFVDESVDGDSEYGYGNAYGYSYGQGQKFFSQFCECSVYYNGLDTSYGGNGFVEWAGTAEIDPVTGTTNKSKPIRQLQSSGLKRRQPLARQFFNWMMANIDSWFKLISDRTPVGAIRLTVDVSQTITDYATRFGGTWVYLGTETWVGGTETTYVFKRTA